MERNVAMAQEWLMHIDRSSSREDAMPTIIGHHNITKGAKHWLTSPKRKELFDPLGVTNIRTFVDPQNPTRVAVLMDVPDMGRRSFATIEDAVALIRLTRDQQAKFVGAAP